MNAIMSRLKFGFHHYLIVVKLLVMCLLGAAEVIRSSKTNAITNFAHVDGPMSISGHSQRSSRSDDVVRSRKKAGDEPSQICSR